MKFNENRSKGSGDTDDTKFKVNPLTLTCDLESATSSELLPYLYMKKKDCLHIIYLLMNSDFYLIVDFLPKKISQYD